jgi:hypothetical protein
MERRVITVKDFQSVAINNEYFLWHFMQKKQKDSSLVLFSYFDKREGEENKIKEIMDLVNIPYFESYVEDSVDFLDNLVPLNHLLSKNDNKLNTCILGFNKRRMVTSTIHGHCLCVEGISEIIYELNPNFIERINLD